MSVITKECIVKLLPVVISDLKHSSEPSRRLPTNENIRRDLYHTVIRDLLPTFKCVEPLADGTSREGIFIKGYVRDVWSYLEDAYDLIHSLNFENDFVDVIAEFCHEA